MLTPRYELEGVTLVLVDENGNVVGEPYALSPHQYPAEVAAWLCWLRDSELAGLA
jgi:hypothetical protein